MSVEEKKPEQQMENLNKLESVLERDIDLLLLEELNVSEEFSSWLYSSITNKNKHNHCKGAWRSISDAEYGESDLVVLYENDFAVLIENKINAVAQPEQANRYKLRGNKGITEGKWKKYVTCMIAPKLYLSKETDAILYDSRLSYEMIRSWFEQKNNPRAKYKAMIVSEAIEQNRRGYTVVADERVTDFWLQYWSLANQIAPELEMKKPNIKPSNSDWPTFKPNCLNKNYKIVHKLGFGFVDLQIAGAANHIDKFQQFKSDEEIEIAEAGQSAAVRIVLEPINRFDSFIEQKKQVESGLEAAKRLLNIAKQFEKEFGFIDTESKD